MGEDLWNIGPCGARNAWEEKRISLLRLWSKMKRNVREKQLEFGIVMPFLNYFYFWDTLVKLRRRPLSPELLLPRNWDYRYRLRCELGAVWVTRGPSQGTDNSISGLTVWQNFSWETTHTHTHKIYSAQTGIPGQTRVWKPPKSNVVNQFYWGYLEEQMWRNSCTSGAPFQTPD